MVAMSMYLSNVMILFAAVALLCDCIEFTLCCDFVGLCQVADTVGNRPLKHAIQQASIQQQVEFVTQQLDADVAARDIKFNRPLA